VRLTGTTTTTPALTAGSLTFLAVAPARVPGRRLRAALSGRGPVPGGGEVGVTGGIAVTVGQRTEVRPQARDAPCTDAASSRGALSLIGARRGGRYDLAVTGPFLAGGAGRLRCPLPAAGGPDLLDDGFITRIAAGRVGGRRIVLRFTRPVTRQTGAHRLTSRPDLTITLVRRRVREQVARPPLGPDLLR